MNNSCTLVFDVGKTNVKLLLLDDAGNQQSSVSKSNKVINEQPYPHYDIDGIWQWLINEIKNYASNHSIGKIVISTHGASAALINNKSKQLMLPVMDYEFDYYEDISDSYDNLRPDFNETYSPKFPAGLNLGRQLHYQMSLLSDEQKENLTLLFYPGYWAWRLTDVLSAEFTSIGCHTDLWNMRDGNFSSLVDKLGLNGRIPKFVPPWQAIGKVTKKISNLTGLSSDCLVLPGIHDSNAGFVPYIDPSNEIIPTVVSTGTWVVAMSQDLALHHLDEGKDMLANINAAGKPLATARYMGGREFEIICEITSSNITDEITPQDIDYIIENNIFAIPSFAPNTGPFPDKKGLISDESKNGKALATVYSALMINELLTNLKSSNDIVIEGSFANNELMCSLIAALRPDQNVYLEKGTAGIAQGCFKLANWENNVVNFGKIIAEPYSNKQLNTYVSNWIHKLDKK